MGTIQNTEMQKLVTEVIRSWRWVEENSLEQEGVPVIKGLAQGIRQST